MSAPLWDPCIKEIWCGANVTIFLVQEMFFSNSNLSFMFSLEFCKNTIYTFQMISSINVWSKVHTPVKYYLSMLSQSVLSGTQFNSFKNKLFKKIKTKIKIKEDILKFSQKYWFCLLSCIVLMVNMLKA